MWFNQKWAESDENQESIQELQISFGSGEMAYIILINKSICFSQPLSMVLAGGDIIWQKPNISP